MRKAITIAIRYAAVRKQFGPPNQSDELAIIEYPLHVSLDSSLCIYLESPQIILF